MNRRCGTCRFWAAPKKETFKDKLKTRFQNATDPVCRHDGKLRGKDEGSGCLGYKEAEAVDLVKRGYVVG